LPEVVVRAVHAIPLEARKVGCVRPIEVDRAVERDARQRGRGADLEVFVYRYHIAAIALAAADIHRGHVVLQVRHTVVMERIGRRLTAPQEGATRATARVNSVAREVRALLVVPGEPDPGGLIGIAARVELVREILRRGQGASAVRNGVVLARAGREASDD